MPGTQPFDTRTSAGRFMVHMLLNFAQFEREMIAERTRDKMRAARGDVKLLSAKRMQVVLPPPKIIHIVIDDKETKVWDRRITWWTPWVPYNPDLERQARLTARDAIEGAAIDMGILDQARRNAEAGIRSLLETLGIKSVSVVSASGKT